MAGKSSHSMPCPQDAIGPQLRNRLRTPGNARGAGCRVAIEIKRYERGAASLIQPALSILGKAFLASRLILSFQRPENQHTPLGPP
jgi:hypothetical protein